MIKRITVLCSGLLALGLIGKAQNTYNEITLPELMKRKEAGDKNMVILDVRTKGEYGDTSRNRGSNIGRIKGAINVTLQELQQDPDAVKQLDPYRDKDIYLICSHSYRSRSASNILLKNGFAHVNNVRGGMTEWYRRYDELSSYRDKFLERGIRYANLSPSELYTEINTGKNPLILGIRNAPRAWYDSFNIRLYRYFPFFRNMVYYDYADSLKVLDAARKEPGRPVVLLNTVNTGAAELAEWLMSKGVGNASYLVGGLNLFNEFIQNKGDASTDRYLTMQSRIRFITPTVYCRDISKSTNILMVDVRHDSLFNKVNKGTKYDFKHLKDAVNFFEGRGTALFEKEFPDRKKEYVLISENGIDGIEFADALSKKGYNITWLTGGLDRWEWYMNNVEDFRCNDFLVER